MDFEVEVDVTIPLLYGVPVPEFLGLRYNTSIMSEILDRQTNKQAIKPPSEYQVVLHNDDYTPFELVAAILMRVFSKNETEALAITKAVHEQGKGIAGRYTRDIAETKQTMAMDVARAHDSPLMLTVEPAP